MAGSGCGASASALVHAILANSAFDRDTLPLLRAASSADSAEAEVEMEADVDSPG
jgi:mevalonate kinase